MSLILDLLYRKVPPESCRRVSGTKGGEWHGPCPVCGGEDRFHVWPEQSGGQAAQRAGLSGTWWCRACDKGGDIIELLEFAEGLDFAAACRELQIELQRQDRRSTPLRQPALAKKWAPTVWPVPAEQWRKQSGKMAMRAHEQLLESQPALEYLASRGLPLDAVRQYRLGYLPPEDKSGRGLYRARTAFGLPAGVDQDGREHRAMWIPSGITIPLWGEPGEEALRIRIRRRKGDLRPNDPKYLVVEGSGKMPMLLPAQNSRPEMTPWVIVEAELDALAVHHACGGRVAAMAVLTNLGKPDVVADGLLRVAPRILVALDFDAVGKSGQRPGYQGWEWWQRTYSQARRWPAPEGKDAGDAYALGVDLAAWINAGLPASLSFLPDSDSQKAQNVSSRPEKLHQSEVSVSLPSPSNHAEKKEQPIQHYTLALSSGAQVHIVDDPAVYDDLVAAGEVVFSPSELARMQIACEGMGTVERALAIERVLDAKAVFGGHVSAGRSGLRHCASADYCCPATAEVAHA